jgi:hypothetical protein
MDLSTVPTTYLVLDLDEQSARHHSRLVDQGAVGGSSFCAAHGHPTFAPGQGNCTPADPALWGTTVFIPHSLYRQIWTRVNRNTPATSQFLKEDPFVAIDQNGQLYGLIFTDDPHPAKLQEPGISTTR